MGEPMFRATDGKLHCLSNFNEGKYEFLFEKPLSLSKIAERRMVKEHKHRVLVSRQKLC